MHIVDCRPVDGDLLSAEFRGKEGLHEVCIRLMTGYETLNPLHRSRFVSQEIWMTWNEIRMNCDFSHEDPGP